MSKQVHEWYEQLMINVVKQVHDHEPTAQGRAEVLITLGCSLFETARYNYGIPHDVMLEEARKYMILSGTKKAFV